MNSQWNRNTGCSPHGKQTDSLQASEALQMEVSTMDTLVTVTSTVSIPAAFICLQAIISLVEAWKGGGFQKG